MRRLSAFVMGQFSVLRTIREQPSGYIRFSSELYRSYLFSHGEADCGGHFTPLHNGDSLRRHKFVPLHIAASLRPCPWTGKPLIG